MDPKERVKREEEVKKQRLDAEDNEFLSLLKRGGSSRGRVKDQGITRKQ